MGQISNWSLRGQGTKKKAPLGLLTLLSRMDSGGKEDAGDGAFGNPLSVDVEEAAYATLPVCGRGHDALHISTVDLDSDDSLLLGVDGNLSGLVLHVIQAGVQGIDLADGERRHGGLTVRGSAPLTPIL